jgi:hypothetical protein
LRLSVYFSESWQFLLGKTVIGLLSPSAVDLRLLVSVVSIVAFVPHVESSLEKFISQAQVPMVSVVVDEQELVWIIQISDSPNTVLIAGA